METPEQARKRQERVAGIEYPLPYYSEPVQAAFVRGAGYGEAYRAQQERARAEAAEARVKKLEDILGEIMAKASICIHPTARET